MCRDPAIEAELLMHRQLQHVSRWILLHRSQLNRVLHSTPEPSGEGICLVSNTDVVMVKLADSCIASMEVRGHTLQTENLDAVWQHARQGEHHRWRVWRQLVRIEVDDL